MQVPGHWVRGEGNRVRGYDGGTVYWPQRRPLIIGIGETDAKTERGGGCNKYDVHNFTPVQPGGDWGRMTKL